MPIQIACSCGKQWRTRDENAGKRVKCPDCGEAVAIPKQQSAAAPAAKTSTTKTATTGTVRVRCECGKLLQVGADCAGKRIRCPECDEMVRVPAGDGIQTSASPAAKAPPPAAARSGAPARDDDDWDDDDWDDDEDEDDRPRKRKKKQASGGSALPLILGGVAVLLLVLVGAAVALYLLLRSDPKPAQPVVAEAAPVPARPEPRDDLDLVDAHGWFLLSARVADLCNSAAGHKILDQVRQVKPDALHMAEEMNGMELTDIERITLVGPGVAAPGRSINAGYFIVATTKPFDRAKVLKAMAPGDAEVQRQGKTYVAYWPRLNPTVKFAAWCVNDHLLVWGEKNEVEQLIDNPPDPGVKGRLSDAVEMVRQRHQFVFAAHWSDFTLGLPAPVREQFSAFGGVEYAQLTGDLIDELEVDIRLTYTDEAKAKVAQDATRQGLDQFGQQLAAMKDLFAADKTPDGAEKVKLVEAAESLLKAPIEQKGPVLHTHLKAPPGTTAIALNQLAGQAPLALANPAAGAKNTVANAPPGLSAAELGDLAYVQTNAPFFASARVADLMNSDLGKKMLVEAARTDVGSPEMLERMTGVAPADIERASLVLLDPAKKQGYFIVATTKPFDRDKILKALGPGAKEKPYNKARYYAFATGDEHQALYFAGDRVFLGGDESAIQQVIDRQSLPIVPGRLSDALRLALRKRQLIVAAAPSQLMLGVAPPGGLPGLPPPGQPGLNPLGPVPGLQSLADVQFALVSADLFDEISLDVSLTYVDEARAQAAKGAIEGQMQQLAALLSQSKEMYSKARRKTPAMVHQEKLLESVETMLRTPINQNGPVLQLGLQTPPGTMPAVLAAFEPQLVGALKGAQAGVLETNNLRQIGVALHKYHEANGHFPPAIVYSDDGKPLYSWRVAILPYLDGGEALAKEFRMNEPWDSANNSKLVAKMPRVYASTATIQPGQTLCKVFSGPGAPFDGKRTPKDTEFMNGLTMVILVAQVNPPVPWSKPVDIPYAKSKPLPVLAGSIPGGFNAVMGDGSVQPIRGVTQPMLRGMIEAGAGN